jgi:MFS transporter, DHA1 family, tetracycline resistance protein
LIFDFDSYFAAGGYLAQTDRQYVFLTSLFLTILDLLYIYLILPESSKQSLRRTSNNNNNNNDVNTSSSGRESVVSILSTDHRHLFSWNPVEVLSIILVDPFLQQVAKVAFLYYTGLWAVISTLSVYAVKRFHLSPERLGELISVLGLSTMVAEAVLVRILVPLMGEKRAMKLGLASFALQCLVLGFAYESWHLFVCAGFSLLGNLVYPSLSSLVSGSVAPDSVGEALGAINGIKALTEGLGPLVFGSLMTISERSPLPGWPYFLAAVLVVAAYQETSKLPDPDADDDDEYIHEIDRIKQRKANKASSSFILRTFSSRAAAAAAAKNSSAADKNDDQTIEEEQGLLSEVDEEEEEFSDDEVLNDIAP